MILYVDGSRDMLTCRQRSRRHRQSAKRLKKARIFKWTAWLGGSSEERISYDCRCCSGKLYKKTKIIGDCSFIPLKLTNFAHILQFF